MNNFFRFISFSSLLLVIILQTTCILEGDIETLRENAGLSLKAPTGLWTISLKPENQVKIIWDNVNGAECYVIEITNTQGHKNNISRQITDITTTYYVDTLTVTDVGTYAKYRIKAISSKRNDSAWSNQVIGTRLNSLAMYDLGDTGPGGGIIVYNKNYFSDDWQYLEAAPASTEKTVDWGLDDTSQNFNAPGNIGAGMSNTLEIINRLQQRGELGKAAQVARALDINGCNDWFLPSVEEFSLMLDKRNLLALKSNDYWSSSTGYLTGTSSDELNRTMWYRISTNTWYVTAFETGYIQRSDKLAIRTMRRF